ncbi:TonB-dependent receptor plug domain-containing protein [Fodinibius sp.]|uniref:TonB-dependent receptor plug domain-containing protein n=1 Tax=Fodinibius sp. TaxID=1872440 RepID=UPI002ACE52BB|nr:TonB-dependent receptor [Fodinibius sp.]MDZ7658669.1 TonB-dependent receptor [Fodinibius sp.]
MDLSKRIAISTLSLSMLIIFFVMGMPDSSHAQQAETLDTLVVSKEVVISSSRVPQTAAGSGRNITTISERMINNAPAHTPDELLRYISGIEVQSRGAFGTQSDFSMRGSTFSQVLVLVDGMRINDPLTAHFNSNIPVAPDEIQRIEVLHGPAAAQYGADAMGGVINIITHTFGSQPNEKKTNARIKGGYGQNDLKMGRAGFYHSTKKYRISGGGMWHQSPGQELADDYKNRFNIANGSVSGGVKLNNNWDLALRTGYDYRDFNARYFYTASPLDEATETVSMWWNQMRLQRSTQNSITTLKGSFKRTNDEFIFNPQFPGNNHTTSRGALQLYQYRQLSGNWDLTYGAQLDNRMIRSNDRGNHSNWHYAGFTMLQWQPNNPTTISGSIRMDHDDNYGTELMPQISFSYQQDQWILRASGGRSVRAPSYTERFISTNLAGPLTEGRNIGNPWLQAERAWSGETGVDLFPWENVRFSATGFVRESTNLIDYAMTNTTQIRNDGNLKAGGNYLYARNINNVTTAGVETELSISQKLGNSWLVNSTLGYAFTDFFGDENVASKYISNYARHLVNGIVSVSRGPVEGSVSAVWKKREPSANENIGAFKSSIYSLWNVKLDYDITKQFSIGVQVDNIFDQDNQDVLGARMPGRWALGTLSWRL